MDLTVILRVGNADITSNILLNGRHEFQLTDMVSCIHSNMFPHPVADSLPVCIFRFLRLFGSQQRHIEILAHTIDHVGILRKGNGADIAFYTDMNRVEEILQVDTVLCQNIMVCSGSCNRRRYRIQEIIFIVDFTVTIFCRS